MEKETKRDLKRGVALVSVLFGVVFLGTVIFNQGSTITGATVVSTTTLLTQTWLASIIGLALLIIGGIALFKLNQ